MKSSQQDITIQNGLQERYQLDYTSIKLLELISQTQIINSALSVCIGFFIPVQLSRVVWEKHSWRLFLINSGYHLVATIAVAVILSLMA